MKDNAIKWMFFWWGVVLGCAPHMFQMQGWFGLSGAILVTALMVIFFISERRKRNAKKREVYHSISMYEATVSLCPHGNDPIDCEPCYVMSDMNYDAARERQSWR